MGVDYKRDAPLLVFNFVSALAIISSNKVVYKVGFTYPVILSVIQYCITWICLDILHKLGKFKKVSETLPKAEAASFMDKEIWLLAMALGFATPVSNISLKLNSVGLYTVSKLLLTPAVVCGDYLLRKKKTSTKRCLILGGLCSAVLLAAETDLQVNFLGSLAICAWLPLAVLYKVGWAKAIKIRKFETLPLMHFLMPYAVLFTGAMALVLEPLSEFAEMEWATSQCLAVVAISGVAAFFVNLSGFLVMGLLSPMTHIVLGQFKHAMMMIIGWIFFGYNPPLISLFGSAIAMIAICVYTYQNVKEQSSVALPT